MPGVQGLETSSRQEAMARLLLRLRAKGMDDGVLFSALGRTPREVFVAAIDADLAYSNRVIPIACGEYIERLDEQIAIITALKLGKKHRVLEIGTGSGFSAALMGQMGGQVVTIERYQTLCETARTRFQQLGFDNIILHRADATAPLDSTGPFDRIVLWPCIEDTPHHFINMLAGNGVLIAPVGRREEAQTIMRYSKIGNHFDTNPLFQVRYQPLFEGLSEIL